MKSIHHSLISKIFKTHSTKCTRQSLKQQQNKRLVHLTKILHENLYREHLRKKYEQNKPVKTSNINNSIVKKQKYIFGPILKNLLTYMNSLIERT